MSEVLVSVDVSLIHDGKLEALKAAMRNLVDFVGANEPEPLAYHAYLDESSSRMTVFQIHPNPYSMERHMKVAGPAFPTFSELLTLLRIDIYGTPTDALLDLLRNKARMLGDAELTVHGLQAGFTRLDMPHAVPEKAASDLRAIP